MNETVEEELTCPHGLEKAPFAMKKGESKD